MFLYCCDTFVFLFPDVWCSLPVVGFAVLPCVRGFLLTKECQRLFTLHSLQLELYCQHSDFSKIQLKG
jgi:hypothetical protein